MKLGIMQPYFFPYIGYFQLINAVDKWVVFDIVQVIRHGWVNRNRILHPKSGWQYIIVPLQKHHREILIKDIAAAEGQEWKKRIIAQLEHYKKKAPFFKETAGFLRECFFSDEAAETGLSGLNTFFLKKVCERLDIKFDYSVCSEMSLDFEGVTEPGEWALEISAQLGAEEYINPPGGRDIFDPAKFAAKGVRLSFLDSGPVTYAQRGYGFEPGLSIIDVMMWNSVDEIRPMLKEYKIS